MPSLLGPVARRGARRLIDAPRRLPEEAGMTPALDALGGEVVRLRARDGLRLTGRWLPAVAPEGGWTTDPREAIVLLHGWSGSVAPDVLEYGPFLRRTAGLLGLDLRGHGGSEDSPTTFGLRETEDVGGALAWLGERGIRRVAVLGTSMGGIVAIASTAILGDGTMPSADLDPLAPVAPEPPPRPRIVAVVADSVTPRLRVLVASRLRGPLRWWVADRILDAAAVEVGEDPRIVEPVGMLPLLEGLPVLLIHGVADTTVPLVEGRRLAAAGGAEVEHLEIAGAEHSAGHRTDPTRYEATVTAFLRRAFGAARTPIGVGSAAGSGSR